MTGSRRREKPLLGAVLCYTAVPNKERTRFAEIVEEMGGEHELNLTSDVTHLLVEVSHAPTAVHLTAKYKYVAAHRKDVRVLQPAWLEAVRQSWMTAEKFNLQALEEEYKLPIFAGLLVCLTGFENLTFRAQLQGSIIAHGGDYRGDLTKNVTHLIANAPEGKKYQYAEQWDVRVVSPRWIEDCLERGMVLEESLYHPTTPLEEQGKGAWNREAKAQVKLGKRRREYQQINKNRTRERIKNLEQQVAWLSKALQHIENKLEAPAYGTSPCFPLATQTHHPVMYSQTSMGIQAMTTPSLVEPRQPEAKAIIDTSDEEGTIFGDTDEMDTEELKEIVAGIVSRDRLSRQYMTSLTVCSGREGDGNGTELVGDPEAVCQGERS